MNYLERNQIKTRNHIILSCVSSKFGAASCLFTYALDFTVQKVKTRKGITTILPCSYVIILFWWVMLPFATWRLKCMNIIWQSLCPNTHLNSWTPEVGRMLSLILGRTLCVLESALCFYRMPVEKQVPSKHRTTWTAQTQVCCVILCWCR